MDKRGFNNGAASIPKSIFGPPPKNMNTEEDEMLDYNNEKAAMAEEIEAMRKKLESMTRVSFLNKFCL